MNGMSMEEFGPLSFEKKLSHLYEQMMSQADTKKIEYELGRSRVERGCDFLLDGMEKRMDERAADYMFDFEMMGGEIFRRRFGYDGGVCTKDLKIYLSDSFLRDSEVLGGATVFHERITKGIKKGAGQFVPVLEESLAHRALFISMGAYDEMKPTSVYETLTSVFGDTFERILSNYESGAKFKEVFNFLMKHDEKKFEKKVLPSYLR